MPDPSKPVPNERGKAARHRHWFHAFPVHFGPYGRQNVHYHVCCAADDPDVCQRVAMAEGRKCEGQPHWRETL